MLRCRRCRRVLLDATCLLQLVEATGESDAPVCAVWHVNVDALPEWILSAVYQAQWTVGKLNCQNCRARLGSFNFVRRAACPCGRDATLHLSKSRVDHDSRHHVRVVQPRRRRPESGQAVLWTGSSGDKEERRGCNGTGLDGWQLSCNAAVSHSDRESTTSSPCCPLDCVSPMKSYSMQPECSSRPSKLCPAAHSSGQSADSCPAAQLFDSDGDASLSAATRPSPVPRRTTSLREQHRVEEEEEEVSAAHMFLREEVAENEEEVVPQTSAASSASNRASKRERNHLKGLRRRQKRRERWLRSQRGQEQAETVDALLMDGETDDRDRYTCPICLDIYFSPRSCRPCGHVFCEPCLRQLAKNRPANTPCPLCRALISHTDFQKELSDAVKTSFPRVHDASEQSFTSSSCAKWPLPSGGKSLRLFWGSERRAAAAAGRRRRLVPADFSLDVLPLGDVRGWLLDVGLVIVCIHSVNWILGFLLLFLVTCCFFS